MRHSCNDCGLSYRNPHDIEEHKRVGCRVESAKGNSFVAEEDVETAETPIEAESTDRTITTCETCGNGVICNCEVPRIPILFATE